MTGHSKSNSNDDDEVESVQVLTEKTNTKRKKPTQRRPMKKRSETWNYYTVLEDNQYKAKCNYCGKIYQCHPRFDGISNMGTHLKVCEVYLNVKQEQDERQQKLATESGEGNASNMVLAKGWSEEACRRAVSKMIFLGELPLNFVDNKGFRNFCNVVVPQFILPSRRTISSDVMDMFLEEKGIFKSLISHFIDSDRCLHRKVISFSVIEDHKGKSIGKKIEACLHEWGIERVCAIIVDNASGNDIAIDSVKNQMLMWKNVDALVLQGDYMHVRCCAHILNLIVTGGLKELHASIAGTQNVVNAKIEEMVAMMKDLLNSLFDAYSGWNSSPPLPSESFPSGSANGGSGGGDSSSFPHLVDDTDRQQGYIMEHGDDTLRVAHPFLGYAKKVLIQNEGDNSMK
ncbi:BED-type domain-containing protein [Citrus sinensis]|nr:BED-type domain-containing protein [Citrus sinensis]